VLAILHLTLGFGSGMMLKEDEMYMVLAVCVGGYCKKVYSYIILLKELAAACSASIHHLQDLLKENLCISLTASKISFKDIPNFAKFI
jgi:hypothetical protein